MNRDGHYVLIYDIAGDKLRNQVAKIAEGYGLRVQKSAFECRLTRGMKERLWRDLEGLELGEQDGVALYGLGSAKPRRLGAAAADSPQAETHHAVIL